MIKMEPPTMHILTAPHHYRSRHPLVEKKEKIFILFFFGQEKNGKKIEITSLNEIENVNDRKICLLLLLSLG